MQENNFNGKNINWSRTGHGLYLIYSGGWCYSHSHQEHNYVEKTFEFTDGDVIVCEYDPINKNLSFIKNNVRRFEMPMIVCL